ncbi:MAG: ABC transporter substrate-binding protein [Thermostichales cyanobacterium BF3_bins_165]
MAYDRHKVGGCWVLGRFLIWVVLGLALWLGGCGPGPSQALILSVISDPKTFNPYLSEESSSREAIGYWQGGLTELDPETLQPMPSLAAGWEVDESGLRYVFTLRPGLRWSDGEPLTAEDVDFTFNQVIFNPHIPTSARDVQRIGGLPAGLTLDENSGVLSGIPTVAGVYHFQVVTDQGATDYRLEVLEPGVSPGDPEGKYVSLPPGIVGDPYNYALPGESQRWLVQGLLPRVRALDERRVEFVLPEPFAPFLIQVGQGLLPKHVLGATVEGEDPEFLRMWGIDTPPEQLVGAGPFVLTEYVPGQRLVYRPNPYYWQPGRPRIPRLIVRIVDSLDTSLLQFRSQETDVYSLRGADFPLLKREEQRDRFTIYDLGPTLNNNFLMFNQTLARDPKTGRPFVSPSKSRWFTDVRFRRAVAHALDRQGLVDSILRGLGQIQHSPIGPASPFHLSPEQGLPTYDYDPDRARAILQAAGYTYDPQGRLRDPDNNLVRFTLHTNAGNTEREAAGSLIKAYLDRIGITVDFVPIAFNTLVQKINTRDWEALLLGFGGGGIEPNNGANIWRSDGRLHAWNLPSQPGSPAEGVVVTDWEREIDQLFVAGVRLQELEARRRYYDRFQVIVQEQLPLIGTFNPLVLTAMRDRLGNRDPRPILGALWNIEELTINTGSN